jgi:hypothetical protein
MRENRVCEEKKRGGERQRRRGYKGRLSDVEER